MNDESIATAVAPVTRGSGFLGNQRRIRLGQRSRFWRDAAHIRRRPGVYIGDVSSVRAAPSGLRAGL